MTTTIAPQRRKTLSPRRRLPARPALLASALLAPALLLGGACLGPQVSDQPATRTDLVLAPGTPVPSLADDPERAAAIDAADGLPAHVPRLSGFADGAALEYWDLGDAPDFASPAFVLHRREGDGSLVELDHPPIFDQLPGEARYSPFRIKVVVEVTETYAGQIIPSVAALNQAQEAGLVGKPSLMARNRNWPVAGAAVAVDPAGDGTPVGSPRTFYYRGLAGTFLDFGETALDGDRVHVPSIDVYVLRREAGEPLSEPARGVDINGDGDLLDTNNVFELGDDPIAESPRCREVSVTVAASVTSIDSSRNQDQAEIRAATQLFVDGSPVSPPVIAFRPEGRTFNCARTLGAAQGN
jgi:hypothetical protein